MTQYHVVIKLSLSDLIEEINANIRAKNATLVGGIAVTRETGTDGKERILFFQAFTYEYEAEVIDSILEGVEVELAN